MKILDSLYSIENFGIYLFAVIGVLIVLFLIILFFGKKDAKKRKEEETKNLSQVKDAVIAQEEQVSSPSVQTPVNVEQPPQPLPVGAEQKKEFVFEEITPVSEAEAPISLDEMLQAAPKPTTNVVLNSDFITPMVPEVNAVKEEPVAPQVPPVVEQPKQEKEFDFDALAAQISKELEQLEKNGTEEPVVVEPVQPKTEEVSFQIFEPLKEEDVIAPVAAKVEEVIPVQEQKKEEVKTRPVMPTVFSSVYVNREKEEPKIIEKQQEQKVEQTAPVTPVVPKIELPKMAETPKKVEGPRPILEEIKNDKMMFQ